MTPAELQHALDWYPFGTDEPHHGDRCLTDKLVTCRKVHECQLCNQYTVRGTINRVRTDVYAGEIATYRWCEECCRAMMRLTTGDDWGDALQERYAIGDEILEGRRTTSSADASRPLAS